MTHDYKKFIWPAGKPDVHRPFRSQTLPPIHQQLIEPELAVQARHPEVKQNGRSSAYLKHDPTKRRKM